MASFKGFSTVDQVRAPYTLTDAELVKRDLLNELYTRKGERVMRPNFGSIVWDLLMDPSTAQLDEAIKDDINTIVKRDPRITLLDTRILVLDHAIRAEIDLRFVPTDTVDTLYLEYQRDITEGTD
jgi:phage baseplate assembly protein W